MSATSTVLTTDQALAAIIAAYREAEEELREEIEDSIRVLLARPDSSRRFRLAQERGVLARLALIRTDLEGQAALFADETLATIYADGMDRADRLMAAGGMELASSATFTAVHREALEVMAADAFDDLAAATDYLDTATKRALREAAKAQTAVGAARGSSVARDTSALVRRFASQGVTGFVDAAGRGWRISAYAEMVVRTKSAQAYNTGTVLRSTEEGVDTFEIRDGERSGHLECLNFSGTTCSGSWALANPVQHPNCVRSFGPLPLHRGPVRHT